MHRFSPPSPAGTFAPAGDLDFYIDVDPATGREMVIVSDTVHQRQHADFLTRHIGGWSNAPCMASGVKLEGCKGMGTWARSLSVHGALLGSL